MVLPVFVLLAVPHASLGAGAVGQKSLSSGGSLAAAPAPPARGQEPSFIDIHYASHSTSYAARAGVSIGDPIDLTGFVTHRQKTGTFSLTRFYVYCCLADAVPYSVDVIAPGQTSYPDNNWLRVRGKLVRTDDELAVKASSVTKVPKPDPPYLY